MKSKNINNFTYHTAISRCLPGTKAVTVTPLTIPKLKLTCRIIVLTPPWHCSPCHTNLCIAIPTEPTEQVGHFVYWKSASSPGSHPTENRICRKDLWALWVAFVFWGAFYFLSFVFISHVVETKLRQDHATKCIFRVTFFIFLKILNVWKQCSVL